MLSTELQSPTCHVRLAIATVHNMVVEHTDASTFHDAIPIITDLYESFQASISFREFAKVITGLKTLVGALYSVNPDI